MALDSITIQPCGPVHGSIRPPGSKSITNRALICAALANGISHLTGALKSDDTDVMISGLRALGIGVDENHDASHDDSKLHVTGHGGRIPADAADLFVGNSGTTVRFLTAMAALGNGRYRLDGVPRMRERPIADLIDALNHLGADVQCESTSGAPPVIVQGHGLAGGEAKIRGNTSSQYLSALLMASPYAQHDVVLNIDGELVSQPYVNMTIRIMESFGVTVQKDDFQRFSVRCDQSYQARHFDVEPDASAASYFWAMAAITEGTVTVAGLGRDALQGDVNFCECLDQMGCRVQYDSESISVTGGELHGIDVNMNAISDTVQTLAAVAVFAKGPTRIRGVQHIRHKETDRIGDLVTELGKLGVDATATADGLTIQPGRLRSAAIETYDDHRMAMSLALVGLRQPGITILNPGCTAKTYPHFFRDLNKLTRGAAG